MNREWSEKNKEIQALLSKGATFASGIEKLIEFRGELFGQVEQIAANYPAEAVWQMPFASADGLHSKTLDYSVWHIFRIEDIVAHEMIAGDRPVFRETLCRDGEINSVLCKSIVRRCFALRGEPQQLAVVHSGGGVKNP